MDKYQDSYLTNSQLVFILIGSAIGVEILNLPIDTIKYARQDGWISCILGAMYPLYLIVTAQYIHKRFPKENILMVSKKCFGKLLGNILNFIFILYFLLITTEIAAGATNVLIIYMIPFLSKYKIIIILLLTPAFAAYKGIKTIARINEVIFYVAFIAFFIPIATLKEGSYLNIMPVFGSGIVNIMKSAKDTALAYGGMEIIFLIYPFFQDNNKLKKCGITSVIITMVIYTWFTFSSIFYLGINIIPKFLWPIVTVTEAVTIPVINSFRYVFLSLWTMTILKILSNHYYALVFGLSQMTKSINRKSYAILMYTLISYVATLYQNPTVRRDFLNRITPIYILYNILYVGIIVLLIAVRNINKIPEQ
ncbi:endospore germination permease [Clostridiaceae bacterium UIB06]|nr:endospore germination permease [Clostridiaceae bacterium UIB06]